MEQQRALNALEPYLALAKSASSPRAAADLVVQATSSPHTFFFAELLQKPNVQALAQSPEYLPYLRLLEIFAWGSYADYKATPNLPALAPTQHHKLLQLSLLPLCASPSTLSYASLQQALSLDTTRQLEDLVTSAIYASLLHAHLDPLNQQVRVVSIAPLRDLAPGSIAAMSTILVEWEGRCADVLAEIEKEISRLRSHAQNESRLDALHQKLFDDRVDKAGFKARSKDESTTSQADQGKQGAGRSFGSLNKKWGDIMTGARPKRSAPGEPRHSSVQDDAMDLDDDSGKPGNRSTRRKGGGR